MHKAEPRKVISKDWTRRSDDSLPQDSLIDADIHIVCIVIVRKEWIVATNAGVEIVQISRILGTLSCHEPSRVESLKVIFKVGRIGGDYSTPPFTGRLEDSKVNGGNVGGELDAHVEIGRVGSTTTRRNGARGLEETLWSAGIALPQAALATRSSHRHAKVLGFEETILSRHLFTGAVAGGIPSRQVGTCGWGWGCYTSTGTTRLSHREIEGGVEFGCKIDASRLRVLCIKRTIASG